MGSKEEIIVDWIRENQKRFLELLMQYCTSENFKKKNLKIDECLYKKLIKINTSVELTADHTDRSLCIPTEDNGRKAKFDLFYESIKPEMRLIIEVKATKIGFRGVAQAAYYSTCLSGSMTYDGVVLLGDGWLKDVCVFADKCLKSSIHKKIVYVTFEDLGIKKMIKTLLK